MWGTKLIEGLRQHRYQFTIITSHDYIDLPDQTSYGGTTIHRLPFRRALAAGDIQDLVATRERVASLKRDLKPDLIHVNAVSASVLFHLLTRDAHPAPVLVRVNHEISKDGAKPNTLMRKVLLAADWVTCVSEALLEQVRRWIPETISRSSVIYSGLNVSFESSKPPPSDRPKLLCLGRLVPAKGFDLALAAFSLVVNRFPDVRLIIAGDGPARPDLERQVTQLGLGNTVEFMSWVEPDAVPTLLRTVTMVLMPSRCEGLPIAAVQAALAGRPIVASRVSGLPEVVAHGETGWLVESEDIKGLADGICFLLGVPEVIARMGEAAQRRAQAIFDQERCLNAYDRLYQKLRQKSAGVGAAPHES